MIPFNKLYHGESEIRYIMDALSVGHLSGNGKFTIKCQMWFEENTGTKKAFLTTSGTHALEIASILIDIKEGDEVIMSSFTSPSTANAFVLRGAIPVFVDIRPDTMNIDETKIEQAITEKTRALVPMHYAGVGCEMDKINDIAKKYGLFVIEDAAHAITAKYKGKTLGTIGHTGIYSFHDTKNISCGEGGVLLINDERFIKRAEIVREKGTNRSEFFRGEVDKYTWIDVGSSYLLSELNAAVLWAQLEKIEEIQKRRKEIWNKYFYLLKPLEEMGHIELPRVPENCEHNAHIFYIKAKNLEERQRLLDFLRQNKICATFHYIPLHSSKAGMKYGRFSGEDIYTTRESERLIRLPIFVELKENELIYICRKIYEFYKERFINK